jgi:VWFA-related protein
MAAARTMVPVITAAAVFALASSTSVSARQDGAPPADAKPPLIIRVGVDLIQIDAAVTDKEGRPVKDLRAEDFTVEVDGKKQPVSNAMFFDGGVGPVTRAGGEWPRMGANPARTLVFMVDDLNVSFESMYRARRAMQKFAADWDFREARVGLRSTSEDGDFITLSNSPERFGKAVSKVHYNIRSERGGSSTPVEMRAGPESSPASGYPAANSGVFVDLHVNWSVNPALARANHSQRVYSLLATINALRSIPGRKAVVLVSEGLAFSGDRTQMGVSSPFNELFAGPEDVDSVLRMITEVANRASVVIYTIDPSGLAASGPGAEVASPPSAADLRAAWSSRIGDQWTLARLSEDTGGLSVYNRNDLVGGLNQIVNDQRAYYLVGFEPPKDAFEKSSGRPKFHEIKLRANRADVRVRTRAGFYGVTDDDVIQKAPLVSMPEH